MIMILSPTWFVDSPIDFEHKQYMLLAFLQKIDKMFKDSDITCLEEVRFHTKNIECFLTTRCMLEMKNIPSPTPAQRKRFKEVASLPDDHQDTKEVFKICKWAIKKLQDKLKEGGLIAKRVEGSLKLYYIGQMTNKSDGYLMLRYSGSPIAEVYKISYESKTKNVIFKHHGNYNMPGKKDFSDIKIQILDEEGKLDDMFIAVDGMLAYNSKKCTLPVLKGMLVANVFGRENTNLFGFKF